MQFTIHAEGNSLLIDVPERLLAEAEGFFKKLDSDMDNGWQMSGAWVAQPELDQRYQIVSDRLLSAMHQGNAELGMLLAAYILARRPDTTGVRIDDSDMSATEFI